MGNGDFRQIAVTNTVFCRYRRYYTAVWVAVEQAAQTYRRRRDVRRAFVDVLEKFNNRNRRAAEAHSVPVAERARWKHHRLLATEPAVTIPAPFQVSRVDVSFPLLSSACCRGVEIISRITNALSTPEQISCVWTRKMHDQVLQSMDMTKFSKVRTIIKWDSLDLTRVCFWMLCTTYLSRYRYIYM